MIEFSVPMSFDDAIDEAAAYPGDVLAIHYDNPELSGEYSFGSDVTPNEFEAQFLLDFGTTPAATGLLVEATVPTGQEPLAAQAQSTPQVEVSGVAFVPAPATFAPEIEAMFTPPATTSTESKTAGATLAGVSDWRASQAEYQITNYPANGINRVTFIYSYWWVESNAPWKIPTGFGAEFETNLVNPNGDDGYRANCFTPAGYPDPDYKTRLAAANQNWNWRVIRPDGVTATSSLGAYADYNDLLDSCNKSSIAIGLRYPQNIQYVNGAYGIIMVIDAPKGTTTMSKISAVIQTVSDYGCTVWPGSVGSKTDCMGTFAGVWTPTSPRAQIILNTSHNWSAPKKCWLTDFTQTTLGEVYDRTSEC